MRRTKPNNSASAFRQRSADQLQRGSISILSVVWLAFTCVGVSLVAQATDVVQRRAFVQESADSIAVAAAFGGTNTAHQLEQRLQVTITQLTITDEGAEVEVQLGEYLATSSASRGG